VDEWFSNPKIHGILQNVTLVSAYMAPMASTCQGTQTSWKKNPRNYKLGNH